MSLTTEKASGAVRAAENDTIVNYWPAYWTMICLFVFYVCIRTGFLYRAGGRRWAQARGS